VSSRVNSPKNNEASLIENNQQTLFD